MRRVLLLFLLLLASQLSAEQPIRITSPRDGFLRKKGPIEVHLLIREHTENIGVLLVYESEFLEGGSSWCPLPYVPHPLDLSSGKWIIVAELHGIRGGKTYLRGADQIAVEIR